MKAPSCSTVIFVVPTCTTSGFVPTFEFAIITSSSTNSICGFTSRGCIFDCSTFVIGIISNYYCSWVVCGSFSSWPLPLDSYCSLFYTSSSLVVPLDLILVSSSWPNVFILVGLPQTNSRNVFKYISNLHLRFFSLALCWTKFFSNSFPRYSFPTSHHFLDSISYSFVFFFVLVIM